MCQEARHAVSLLPSGVAFAAHLPRLCRMNVDSLDPIGPLKEMPLQQHDVRHSTARSLILHTALPTLHAPRRLLKNPATLAVTLTSSRRGCRQSSSRSSAHLHYSQARSLQAKAHSEMWRTMAAKCQHSGPKALSVVALPVCSAVSKTPLINLLPVLHSTSARPDHVQQPLQSSRPSLTHSCNR